MKNKKQDNEQKKLWLERFEPQDTRLPLPKLHATALPAGWRLSSPNQKRDCQQVVRTEFDPRVAEDVGVGRPSALDLRDTLRHHSLPVLAREVDHAQLHANLHTHTHMHTGMHWRTYTCMHALTHMQACIDTHMQACTHPCIRASGGTWGDDCTASCAAQRHFASPSGRSWNELPIVPRRLCSSFQCTATCTATLPSLNELPIVDVNGIAESLFLEVTSMHSVGAFHLSHLKLPENWGFPLMCDSAIPVG